MNVFDQLHISLATADDIRNWSCGEVKKPETINYRTLKPEKDGLFCEKIFGPTRDWECACGKYKRVRYKGITCERCGVEVTRSRVRRERMGHIELAAPVTHIWYFKGVPSRLGYLLDLAPKDLEKVIYFAAYMVTSVDEQALHEDMPRLVKQHEMEIKRHEEKCEAKIASLYEAAEAQIAELEANGKESEADKVRKALDRDVTNERNKTRRQVTHLESMWETFNNLKVGTLIGDEVLYRDMCRRWSVYFEGCMGAQAIKKRLETFDLEGEAEVIREVVATGSGQRKTRALKRIKVINAFITTGNSPMGMVLDAVPVIPPDLRPMVQLDGGRFATSDLNDLYRRVINRNNRLKRLLALGAPEIIVNNEKRMLQESVDALFDNGRRGRPVSGPGNRPLKSLSDMLKGKQGRFRQNLLGKRVDYSGRSVIVVGPTLKLHQCGLPKTMALELFKPFVMKRLVEEKYSQNVKSAKRAVESQRTQVWDMLEQVIKEHPVLLNRAPTLHRLGIQAFEPQLVEGKAIQLHPLVCAAFNADFDGDQMAVHLPLSAEAQAEARVLMLSSNNILKPSDGRPVTVPSQDMIIGLYTLTTKRDGAKGEGRHFSSVGEAIMAYDRGELALDARCYIRFYDLALPVTNEDGTPFVPPAGWEEGQPITLYTTLGQTIFNDLLPTEYPFVMELVEKKRLGALVNHLAETFDKANVTASLDALKSAGFTWSTRSGVTIAMSDVVEPPQKEDILARYEEMARDIQDQYDNGLILDEDRKSELIKIWTDATEEVAEAMRQNFPADNTVNRMVTSGARGNWMQIRQIAGMRGLVADPKGEIIPRPIKSNYFEGLTVLEYFMATHGSRKGMADTALRTAESGYLTRRLVDVSQDVIIREHDCGTKAGLKKVIAVPGIDGKLELEKNVETSVYTRTLAQDIALEDGTVVAYAGDDLGDVMIERLVKAGVTQVKVRSVLTCESRVGACAMCYGRSLAAGKLVDIGEAVGIIAAQSIGEPGTQLTMRTFHTGGAAGGEDITQGLPRVQELFEARTPKSEAPIAELPGKVKIEEDERARTIIITPDKPLVDPKGKGKDLEELRYVVPKRVRLRVVDGEQVEVGQQLVDGAVDPKKIVRIKGRNAAQQFLVDQVQETYKSQGVDIHDKHIEVIVRQMLRRVTVLEPGDTQLLPGELVDRSRFQDENRRVIAEGGKPASARAEIMGITKASLATDSWLSAASFQETTRVLTEAAMNSKVDPMVGLKENVILGKLIPAGTGLQSYRDVVVEPSETAKAELFDRMGYGSFDLDASLGLDNFSIDTPDFGNFEIDFR